MHIPKIRCSMQHYLMALLLLFSVSHVFAQKGEFGVRFMPTFSSFDVQNSSGGTINGEATFGLGAGVLLAYNFTEHVGIQGEVIYNKISQKYAEADIEREVSLKYVNIPLLLSLNTGKTRQVNFNLVIGPQIGLSVGSDLFSSDENDSRPVLEVKKGDLGIAYGAGMSIGLVPARTFRLGLGFRGVQGIVDISDNGNNLTGDSYYLLDRSRIKTYSGYIGLSLLF